ncbi:MAG TPA: hypothetical protein VML54_12090 [Candidatus Limnocylindrales bacterium]|nr:hypothetical protein [Candidatus Limnocylindrales bacterium]
MARGRSGRRDGGDLPSRLARGAAGARKGGVLKVGLIGEPPTLDQHTTTAVITREIGINMFEGLFALDGKRLSGAASHLDPFEGPPGCTGKGEER